MLCIDTTCREIKLALTHDVVEIDLLICLMAGFLMNCPKGSIPLWSDGPMSNRLRIT